MTFKESLDYLYTQLPMFQRVGPKAFKKNLDNIEALVDLLDHPEQAFPSVHLAGTNGKGTTAHLIAAALQSAGYTVALYTSPHYRDFRERIKINGEFIDQTFVTDFVSWYKKEASHIKASFFEITVAMAFSYFRSKEVDIAVIETGLGGRLDSTNVLLPLLSVITNISLDHTNFLGETLALIASEKAGIIKHEVPVLIGRRQAETGSVFASKSELENAPLYYAEELVDINSNDHFVGQEDHIVSPFFNENKRTAIAAVNLLNKYSDFIIDNRHIDNGIAHIHELTYFIGRWMIMSKIPLTIGDSAHNLEGLHIALNQLSKIDVEQKHFVLGFVNDKDLSKVLSLFPSNATYYFAKADIPRGLNAEELRRQADDYGLEGKAYSSVNKAFSAAQNAANDNDLIYVGGSIFTLAEVI